MTSRRACEPTERGGLASDYMCVRLAPPCGERQLDDDRHWQESVPAAVDGCQTLRDEGLK